MMGASSSKNDGKIISRVGSFDFINIWDNVQFTFRRTFGKASLGCIRNARFSMRTSFFSTASAKFQAADPCHGPWAVYSSSTIMRHSLQHDQRALSLAGHLFTFHPRYLRLPGRTGFYCISKRTKWAKEPDCQHCSFMCYVLVTLVQGQRSEDY